MTAYIAYIKKNILTLITCIVLMASVFIVYTVFAIPNKYDAKVTITVDQNPQKYMKIVKSEGYINAVSSTYNLEKKEVLAALQMTVNGHDLTIRARCENAITSKKIVDALSMRLLQHHSTLLMKSGSTVASKPSSPSLLFNGALGGVCGLIIGFIVLAIQMYISKKDQA